MLTRTQARTVRRSGASALALATALIAGPIQAQSINAPAPNVVSGSASYATTGTVDTITITSNTAVLDFTPTDTGVGGGPINFQNAGTTLRFERVGQDFTVLNRIVPADTSRAIQFNGTVESRIVSTITNPGGSVWFYSPGGIILGAGASFDVGSLLLATGDPTGGTGTISTTNSFLIESAADTNPAITISPTAQIKALQEGSYIALVAPVVNQNGSVKVNGSAAYVAAETASLTINQGLFNIDVQVGSSNGGATLVHQGSTSGPSSTGTTGDNHGIFMAAVPKNSAITMLIAPDGQLGFDVAAQAGIENGAIYLMAGDDLVVDPAQTIVNRIGTLPQSAQPATIQLNSTAAGTDITSAIAAHATTDVIVSAGTAGGLTLREESYFFAGKNATITAFNAGSTFTANDTVIVNSFGQGVNSRAQIDALAGTTMTFNGDVRVHADVTSGRFFGAGFDVSQGGNAALRSTAGTITVTGKAQVTALGFSPNPVSTKGGNADISLGGGSITIAGNAEIRADAQANGAGLSATAGQANIFAGGQGVLKVGNQIDVNASASGNQGASATGGRALLVTGSDGGSIEGKFAFINASAGAADVISGTAGSATGGDALIQAVATGGPSSSIKLTTTNVVARADAAGGSSSGTVTGAAATGGLSRILIGANGSFTTTGAILLDTTALGGQGSGGGAGGDATGGNVQINANIGTIATQNITLLGETFAGAGGTGPSPTTPGGAGGQALAGAGISVFADNGSITGTFADIQTEATGGLGGSGFNATGSAGSGGSAIASPVFVGTNNNGQITLGNLTIIASAFGGNTGSGTAQPGGTGGAATSANANVGVNSGLVQVASLDIRSESRGGTGFALGANGGAAVSKNAGANATNGGTLKVTGGLFELDASADGGDASGVPGGALVQAGEATAGLVNIFAGTGGTVDSSAAGVFLEAGGFGGAEFGNGNVTGAIGRGGNARVNASGGTIILRSDVDIEADGQGGDGGGTGNGGAGIGGEARLGTFGAIGTSKVDVTGNIFLDASGSGGDAEAGLGGDGLGGTPPNLDTGPFDKGAYLVAIGGNVTVGGAVDLDASGFGGASAIGGGSGVGGFTNLVSFGAAISAPGVVNMNSSGQGGGSDFGLGGKGGAGKGGFVQLSATSGGDSQGGGVVPLGTPGSVVLGTTVLDASGEGGEGGSAADGQAGGLGGDGTAGRVIAVAQAGSGTLKSGDLFIFLQGEGGIGGDGGQVPATGGSGGAGGQGGVGTAGFANFGTVSGPDTTSNTGSATFTLVNAFLTGIGGDGGAGGGSATGGAGGIGVGGNGAVLSRGTPVTTSTISINASGFGGQGGSSGGAQGVGGAAQGGSASMLVTNRFNRPEQGSLFATDVNLFAGGFAGSGSSSGAGTAGRAFAQVTKSTATVATLSLVTFGENPPPAGSETGLVVDAATLNVASTLSISGVGDLQLSVLNGGVVNAPIFSLSSTGSLLPPTAGTPGLINISGDFFASFGQNFVSTADFSVGGTFSVDAGGTLQVGNVTAGGDIDLSADGPLTAGNLTAGDSVRLFAEGSITAGDIVAGQANTTDVFGDLEIASFGSVVTGNITAATVDIQAGDPIVSPTSVLQTGAITAETISLDVAAGITTGDLRTADIYANIDTSFDNYLIGIGSAGNVKIGNVDAFTSIGVGSRNGSVQAGTIKANDSVMLLAGTTVSAGGVTTGTDANDSLFVSNTSIILSNPDFAVLQDFDELGGEFDIAVLANATPVRVSGPIAFSGPISTVNFAAATSQSFTSGAIAASRRLFLDVGGAITGGALSTNNALVLSSDQSIDVGNLTGNSIDLTSKQNVTAGNLNATGTLIVTATGTATFTGQASAQTIQVRSADISLGTAGRLGTTGTSSLTLISDAGATRIGGAATGTGYVLDAGEAQRLQAAAIDVQANGSITLGQLSLLGSDAGTGANLVGSTGRLTISAGSTSGLRVTGAVAVGNAAAANRLTLNAGGGIEVVTDQGGSIAMTGSGSNLGGTLVLNSPTVRAASSSLLNQLSSLSPEQRAQALLTPTGGARPEGWLQANTIEFRTNQLFIQNSNTATTFGGFTGGTGTSRLVSRSGGSSPVDAIIFGRFRDSSGAFKINQDAVSLLTLGDGEGVTTVTSTSLFNTCSFTGSCAAPPPAPEEEEDVEVAIDRIANVVAATIADALSSTAEPESVAALPTVNLVTTIDTGPIRTEPVISDPVTGGGNPGLWDTPSDQDQREDERPAPGGDGQ